jgi:hypothetical protein
MPNDVPGGLIVCSLDNYNAGTGVFSNISVPGMASVAGNVFHDLDADEVIDAGEPAMSGVLVYLDSDNDGVRDAGEATATTNASGAYSFADVAPGGYTVRHVAPPNYCAANAVPVTVALGSNLTANLATALLMYTGTAGDDQYLIRKNAAGKYEILDGGSLVYTVFAGAPWLALDLLDGDDTLTVDAVQGAPAPTGGLSFIGGANTAAGDKLAIRGAAAAENFTFYDGSTVINDRIVLNSGGEIVTFDGNGGGDNLTISSSAHVTLAATQRLASLTIAGGTLDLLNHDLLIDYNILSPIGSWNGAAYTGITGLIASGRNGGTWDGSGIVSSLADPGGYMTLGVAEATEVLGITGSDTMLWSGQTADATTVLVKFTYGGDANLSGTVDIDDYGQIDFNSSVGGVLAGFYNGDFDYNGVSDIDDYGIIDFVFPIQ